MKKSKMVIAFVSLAVFFSIAMADSAFATGSTLYHNGTSTYSYVSSDYVSQMNDNWLYCESGIKKPVIAEMECYGFVIGEGRVSNYAWFSSNAELEIPDVTYIRNVHVKIVNYDTWEGTSVRTIGDWTLFS